MWESAGRGQGLDGAPVPAADALHPQLSPQLWGRGGNAGSTNAPKCTSAPPEEDGAEDERAGEGHSQRVAKAKPTPMKAMPTIRFH